MILRRDTFDQTGRNVDRAIEFLLELGPMDAASPRCSQPGTSPPPALPSPPPSPHPSTCKIRSPSCPGSPSDLTESGSDVTRDLSPETLAQVGELLRQEGELQATDDACIDSFERAVDALQALFPSASIDAIADVLISCDGDVTRAADTLGAAADSAASLALLSLESAAPSPTSLDQDGQESESALLALLSPEEVSAQRAAMRALEKTGRKGPSGSPSPRPLHKPASVPDLTHSHKSEWQIAVGPKVEQLQRDFRRAERAVIEGALEAAAGDFQQAREILIASGNLPTAVEEAPHVEAHAPHPATTLQGIAIGYSTHAAAANPLSYYQDPALYCAPGAPHTPAQLGPAVPSLEPPTRDGQQGHQHYQSLFKKYYNAPQIDVRPLFPTAFYRKSRLIALSCLASQQRVLMSHLPFISLGTSSLPPFPHSTCVRRSLRSARKPPVASPTATRSAA